MPTLSELTQRVGASNRANGWHERYAALAASGDAESVTDHVVAKLALIDTEVSEAIEEVRRGRGVAETWYSISGREVFRTTDGSGADWTTHPAGVSAGVDTWTGVLAKPEGVPSELADVLIRAMDLAFLLGIDIEREVLDKLEYNGRRGKKHGGKVL